MNRNALRAAAVAAAVLLAASELPAYLIRASGNGTEVTWNLDASAPNVVGGRITYYIDEDSAVDVSPSQFADAVGAAVQAWEDVDGSAVAFTEDAGRSTTVKNSSDKINRFGFTPGVLPPFAFASAFAASSNNRITDVDVVFNPSMTWSVQFPGDSEKADVQGVAAHEWGHGLGLDHVPLNASTMFWAASYGAVSLRSLEADDAAAVIHAYPGATADTAFARVSGDVDVAGAPDDRGVQVTAIDFSTGLPAVSTLSAPDGSYVIEGLPPGVYRLVAGPIGTGLRDDGVYSAYWGDAVTTFMPAVRGEGGAADGSTGVVIVAAGDQVAGADFTLTNTDPTGEPNDSFSTARAVTVGMSICGRIADTNDHDWFSFQGQAGQSVSIYLHAGQIGSVLDARLFLRNAARTEIAFSDDISKQYTQPQGADYDCRILDFELPSTGTYYVEIQPEVAPDSSVPEDYFYALTLLAGGGTPSALTSVLTASPAVIPADGSTASTVTFEPRTLTGGLSGPGLAVAFDLLEDGDADGVLSGVADHGDGTYTATLTAPSSAGSDTVRARVDGTAVSTATVSFLGEAAFATSGFAASPRRMRPDGASSSVVTFVPRDAQGLALGTGHTVVLSLDGSFASSISSTTAVGDGSYRATVSAGDAYEVPGILATTDGKPLDQAAFPVAVGFPLDEVRDAVIDDLEALLAGSSLPVKSVARVRKARDLLALAAGEPAVLVKGIQKGVKQLEAAARKGAPVADLAAECAEACRQLAGDAIEAATPDADTAAEQKNLLKAGTLFDAGDLLIDALQWSRSCGKYSGALKKTAGILP